MPDRRWLALAFLLSAAYPASAQEADGRYGLRVGFALGNGFTDGTLHTHIEGFEIGAEAPIIRRLRGGGSLYFSPTLALGGSNRKGRDTDGLIFRLPVTYKHGLGAGGLYAGAGFGLGFTQARRGHSAGAAAGRPSDDAQFSDVAGVIGEFLLGYRFAGRGGRRTEPFLELAYFAGSDEKLSGFSFDTGIRF